MSTHVQPRGRPRPLPHRRADCRGAARSCNTASTVERAPHTSYADYLALEAKSDEKHEYFDGLIFAMSGGTLEHGRLAGAMVAELTRLLRGKACRVFSSDARVRVESTNRSTYPDVSVVCGELLRAGDDHEAIANPRLLVEVLSESTEGSDRGEKFAHYRRLESLSDYVLISQRERRVECFLDACSALVARPGSLRHPLAMNSSLLRGLCLLPLLVLLACGDDSGPAPTDAGAGRDSGAMGSGLDRSKRVPSLSGAEVAQLCSWGVAAAGGPGVTATCPAGDVTTQTVAECEASVGSAPAGCTATVGEIEDCMEAMGADACALYSAPACQALIACATAAP